MSVPPTLELVHVDASYGAFRALFDVSLTVPARSATALLGSNGSGKTTVARIASGLVHPSSGHVLLEGADITDEPAFRVARRGVAHAPEGRSVIASLTVEENLLLGSARRAPDADPSDLLAQAYDLFPRLGERSKQLAGLLSGGEQRMLSLARVLILPPTLLIADELSLGLAPIIVDEVYANLAKVKARGTSLLIIEQHVPHALDLADHLVILDRGHVRYQGPVLAIDRLTEHLLPAGSTRE